MGRAAPESFLLTSSLHCYRIYWPWLTADFLWAEVTCLMKSKVLGHSESYVLKAVSPHRNSVPTICNPEGVTSHSRLSELILRSSCHSETFQTKIPTADITGLQHGATACCHYSFRTVLKSQTLV